VGGFFLLNGKGWGREENLSVQHNNKIIIPFHLLNINRLP
jgi:hypothetical protein